MTLDNIRGINEGSWVVRSKDGVEKRFPQNKEAEAHAWANTIANPPKSAATMAPKKSSLDLDTVWNKVEEVVANIFPDGDPIDWLGPWLQKHGITDFKIGEILDKAAKKNGYDDIYDYYDQMKKQYDADMGSLDEDASEVPEVGDTVRTKKMQMTGKVEKVEPHHGHIAVFFRLEDGRLMRAPVDNVTVVEKLADQGMYEGFPHDVDHMPGRVIRDETSNKTVRYFYNEWKELADRANAEQHSNGLVISSGPESVIYQEDDGTIYAKWDKRKKMGFVKGKTTEGSMGGINRSAPAQDVSYEKVLDEVMNKWLQETQINELSVEKLRAYQKAAAAPSNIKTRPMRKLAKTVVGYKNAGDKIAAKTGDRSGRGAKTGPINSKHQGTYEERLAEFIGVDEDCWDGYEQIGMKDKGGKKVPNCVPKTNEVYQGPWQGDPDKYKKAPASSTKGSNGVTLSSMVRDSVKTHGVKWAFEYYVKKHGMPPRHFRIYAGI